MAGGWALVALASTAVCTGCVICQYTAPNQCTGGRGEAATPALSRLVRGARRRRPRRTPLEAPCRRDVLRVLASLEVKQKKFSDYFKCNLVVD